MRLEKVQSTTQSLVNHGRLANPLPTALLPPVYQPHLAPAQQTEHAPNALAKRLNEAARRDRLELLHGGRLEPRKQVSFQLGAWCGGGESDLSFQCKYVTRAPVT